MKIFTLIFFIFSLSLSAQIKGVVTDSLSGKPIPYVTITLENENIGTTSEENGTFILNFEPKNQAVLFSGIGFESKKIPIEQIRNVQLKSILYPLNEVVVTNLKRTLEIEVGNSKNRFFLPESQIYPWILARKIQIEPSKPEVKYLKNLIFFTKSETNKTFFRARIFAINKEGLPGEDLISEEILVKVKKGRQKTTVDVSALKIKVPDEGIVVGFESLLTKDNQYWQEASVINSKKSIKVLNYGPHLLYSFENKEDSYTCRNGKWVKQRLSMNRDKKSTVLTPAINVTLTN